MEYSREDTLDILCEDREDFECVTDEQMVGKSRWSTHYKQVFKRLSDQTFWQIRWTRGSTEYQDEGYEDLEMCQVWPKQVTKTVYVEQQEKAA